MKKIVLVLMVLIISSPIYAGTTMFPGDTLEDFSNIQFKLEGDSKFFGRYTYANEPQKTKYFLMGPNTRIHDKGVMDLGAYKKGPIRLIKNSESPDLTRIEINFSAAEPTKYDPEKKTMLYETALYKVIYLKEEKALMIYSARLDAKNNLISTTQETLQNCMSIGLPW
jgi:hypothetical protein